VDFDNVVITMIETRMDHSDRVSYGAKWWQSGERKSVKLKQSIQIWVSKGLQIKPCILNKAYHLKLPNKRCLSPLSTK
jgi:hypothetical protein